ncbi:lipoyl domain-containing protein [Thermus tengchongensis]|uniref:Biotin attachment protein n=1 Tax=Thermus tengchongensis TaxID=1214928 RepID=A0A4Y9EU04_9DEIN|nr:lipoyl domain-containing protein [Thermus tengchongensis]TFU14870.1 biotin attachment protein [Thermus tengchongensis]
MALKPILMPQLGLTMQEGTFQGFLKAEGERFRRGEPLFQVESDKALVEVEAEVDGVLKEVLAEVGKTYPVGAVLGFYEEV